MKQIWLKTAALGMVLAVTAAGCGAAGQNTQGSVTVADVSENLKKEKLRSRIPL